MATIIECDVESGKPNIVVTEGVDISGGVPAMTREVMLVVDNDNVPTLKRRTLLNNMIGKWIRPRS